MVKKSMNPALIVVVVILVVLIGAMLYTNSKEKYTSFWEHIPLRGDNYTDQCRVSPGGQFRPGNSFKCLPKTSLGQKIWNLTRQRAARRLNKGYNVHLFSIQDRFNFCQGQAVICTSEGAFVDHLKRRVDPSQIIGNTSPSCRDFCGPILSNVEPSRTGQVPPQNQNPRRGRVGAVPRANLAA